VADAAQEDLEAPVARAVVRADSDLKAHNPDNQDKARKPDSRDKARKPDNRDKAGSRDSAPNALLKSANAL